MKSKYITIVLIIMMVSSLFSQGEIVMDKSFFRKFSAISAISRDDYLEGFINGIIIGRGKITSVSESERYRKKFRVAVESTDSSVFNQKFTFFLFLDNQDTADLLTVGTDFEFKGQFMGYTPVNIKRNSYVIDVVLMDASTVIE